MKISSFRVNTHAATRLGLGEIEMRDLGQIIVLVGENGCGKTRLLDAIDWSLRRIRNIGYANLRKLEEDKNRQKEFAHSLLMEGDDHYAVSGAHDDYETYLKLLTPMEGLEISFEDGVHQDEALSAYCILSDTLRTPTSSHLRRHFSQLAIGVPRGNVAEDQLLIADPIAYILDICLRSHIKNHESIGLLSSDANIGASIERLADLVLTFTGLPLKFKNRRRPTLGGLSLDRVNLSDGQLSLLRSAVLLHSKTMRDIAIPILLDEPEVHLHPARLVLLVDQLRKLLPRSQLWIATHNLALAAHIAAEDPRAIWYGSKGEFSRSGLTPERVVNGLLGGPAGGVEISDFCTKGDVFAFSSFCSECLCPPGTVAYKAKDPQVQQIVDFLTQHRSLPLTVIDLGAGQARLLDGLYHLLGASLTAHVSYFAIEPLDDSYDTCEARVSEIYSDSVKRVFRTAADFITHNGKSGDVLVLANVLHEIPVDQWISVFADADTLLNETGCILIVEDTRLPKGELAHGNGFLILEEQPLRALFGAEDEDQVQSIKSSREGARLQATAFRRNLLHKISTNTIASALGMQQAICVSRIKAIRESSKSKKVDYAMGREHAFHTQLLANTFMAIDELRTNRAG